MKEFNINNISTVEVLIGISIIILVYGLVDVLCFYLKKKIKNKYKNGWIKRPNKKSIIDFIK